MAPGDELQTGAVHGNEDEAVVGCSDGSLFHWRGVEVEEDTAEVARSEVVRAHEGA